MKTPCLTILIILALNVSAIGQRAELHIENESSRHLTVKIMKSNSGVDGQKYSQISIPAHSKATEYFSKPGFYYLKTKAVKPGKETMYKKGDAFEVYVGRDGYSILTITYSITESNIKNPMEGEAITKSEFESDNN